MKPLALRNILVATDLGPNSAAALRNACQLADLSGADLHVVHAMESPAENETLEQRVAAASATAGRQLDMTVLTGPAAALITQEAARTQADVIVLGGHRKHPGAPLSTADRVVRTARVSCLILPDHLELPLSSVLVPVDATEAARGTLAVGLTWASALRQRNTDDGEGTAVRVLHVAHDDAPDGQMKRTAKLRAQVTDISTRVADAAGVAIEQDIANSPDVPGTILREAQKRGTDLIVLGTRGERVENDPLGSVSSEVVKSAGTPILLVPPEVWRPDAQEVPS